MNTVVLNLELSAAYFNRVFKNEKGIAYSEYLNRIRLTKAKELIVDIFRGKHVILMYIHQSWNNLAYLITYL